MGRKLTVNENNRLNKFEEIAEQLSRGKNVWPRQLNRWLAEVDRAQFDIAWAEQKEIREDLKHKPSELKRYEKICTKRYLTITKRSDFVRKVMFLTLRSFET